MATDHLHAGINMTRSFFFTTYLHHFSRISPSFADVYVDALVKDGFVSLVSICTLSLEDLETGETAVRIPKADRYNAMQCSTFFFSSPVFFFLPSFAISSFYPPKSYPNVSLQCHHRPASLCQCRYCILMNKATCLDEPEPTVRTEIELILRSSALFSSFYVYIYMRLH